MGKTYNAPQITLTQKHITNTYRSFRTVHVVVGRSSVPTSGTGKTIGISTSALDRQPTRLPPAGKSPKLFPDRHFQTATITRRESRLPTFRDIDSQPVSWDRPPVLHSLSSLATRTYVTPWATALLAREVPLEPMMEMSGLASQRSSMTGL